MKYCCSFGILITVANIVDLFHDMHIIQFTKHTILIYLATWNYRSLQKDSFFLPNAVSETLHSHSCYKCNLYVTLSFTYPFRPGFDFYMVKGTDLI